MFVNLPLRDAEDADRAEFAAAIGLLKTLADFVVGQSTGQAGNSRSEDDR